MGMETKLWLSQVRYFTASLTAFVLCSSREAYAVWPGKGFRILKFLKAAVTVARESLRSFAILVGVLPCAKHCSAI
jgi:hypothetical protein